MADDDWYQVDEILLEVRNEVRATRQATERTADNVLQFGQELQDFRNHMQKITWRVESLERARLPLRFPWLSLVLSVLSFVAVMILAWKVLR